MFYTPVMKNIYSILTAIVFAQALFASNSFAQTTSLKPAPANIKIDGSLSEWGDSLSFTNPETRLRYTLANDKDNLYLAVKTDDPVQQHAILAWGLTLGIDTKGHKKTAYTVLFPYHDDDAALAFNPTEQEKKQEITEMKLKRIQAEGFKDVEVDVFTQENLYGFRVAVNYDEHGNLIYEEQIPLKLFHADINSKTEWAFNIKLNHPEPTDKKPAEGENSNASMGGLGSRGGMGGGRGGMGGGGGRRGGMGGGMGGGRSNFGGATGSHDSAPKSVDFWAKYTLAIN